jgi:hypothetical protein
MNVVIGHEARVTTTFEVFVRYANGGPDGRKFLVIASGVFEAVEKVRGLVTEENNGLPVDVKARLSETVVL